MFRTASLRYLVPAYCCNRPCLARFRPGAGFTFSTPVSSVAFVPDEFVDEVDFYQAYNWKTLLLTKRQQLLAFY